MLTGVPAVEETGGGELDVPFANCIVVMSG